MNMEEHTGTIFDALGPRPKMAELVDWRLIELNKTEQTITIGYTAQELFANPMGFVHGGFIVAMLDETMGSTVIGLTDAKFFSTTISLSVDFMRPVKLGAVVCAAKMTKMGKDVAFLESHLSSPQGTVLARATASYKLFAFDVSAIQSNMHMP